MPFDSRRGTYFGSSVILHFLIPLTGELFLKMEIGIKPTISLLEQGKAILLSTWLKSKRRICFENQETWKLWPCETSLIVNIGFFKGLLK